MEELSYKAKIAVIRILNEIMNADNIVHEKEVEYLDEVIKSFNMENDYKEDVKGLMTLEALSTIRSLSIEQKGEIAQMMGNMIVADKDINYNEVKLYNAFCESCAIDKDFNVDDYTDVIQSGPFLNPEDMMNSNMLY
jgi:uncharacterized tellurite resistance protein B-like protein